MENTNLQTLIVNELIRLGIKNKYGCEIIPHKHTNECRVSKFETNQCEYDTIQHNYNDFDKNRQNKDGYIFLQEFLTNLSTDEHLQYLQEFKSVECFNKFLFRMLFDSYIKSDYNICDRINFLMSELVVCDVVVQNYKISARGGVEIMFYVYEKIKE